MVLRQARLALEAAGLAVTAMSAIVRSAPIGPSARRYANAAAIVKSRLDPDDLLATLKKIERAFGRRSGGRRWAARVLDLDIVLWSKGCWASTDLCVPHIAFRERGFVLGPAMQIAPDWRDPVSGLRLRHLQVRLTRPRTIHRPA